MFLRLVDDGTLDNARGMASNGTFWSMLYGLPESRPDWTAEVLKHWLLRRFQLFGSQRAIQANPRGMNYSNMSEVPRKYWTPERRRPKHSPNTSCRCVLKIADEATYKTANPAPKHDSVWGMVLADAHLSMNQTCMEVVARAAEELAEVRSEGIDDILTELRGHMTRTANFILLRAFRAGARHFADEAVSELCTNTWRFQCGYSDSPYWIATQLITAVAPLCSDANRARLQRAILAYASPYEVTPDGYKLRGEASFNLLSGIPVELRSPHARARYMELERKFGDQTPPPQRMQAYRVGSPIEKSAAEKMTDEQWLNAIRTYDSTEGKDWWAHPEKGGALELARMLEDSVMQEPERFARLSATFPPGTHPYYIGCTLSGLKETNVSTELKLKACRKAYDGYRHSCGKDLADMLGAIEEPLPFDAVQMLDWLSTRHPDPEQEMWNEQATGGTAYYGGNLLDHGINTTRGRAAWAIRNLVHRDASYVQRFRCTVEKLANDGSAAVRASTASTLLAIVEHAPEFALRQFLQLIEPRGDPISDERLLATPDVERFLNFGLHKHFGYLQSVVERMLHSSFPRNKGSCVPAGRHCGAS